MTAARNVAAVPTAAIAAAVMLLSAILLLPRLGEPAGAIWDESYYLGAASRYEQGRTQFASHPPLGLMLIAAGDVAYGRIAGERDRRDLKSLAASKSVRGESIPAGFDFTGMRIASALTGVVAAGLFFWLMLTLCGAPLAAAALSLPFVLDTALTAQFRAAQLDSFQVAFTLFALVCAVRAVRRPHWGWALGFALAVGAAAMVRANAALLAAGGPFLLWAAWRDRGVTRAIAVAAAGFGGFATAVIGVFALHFAVAPRPPDPNVPAGVADAAWVSPVFADYLAGGALTPARLYAGMRDYVRYMDNDLKGMPLTDANGSRPATWPAGWRPIQYRWDAAGDVRAYVALVPNYPAWWLSLAGIAVGATALAAGRRSRSLALLVTLWAVFVAAHWWLAGQRVLYLYNYFLPLLFGWACLAALWRHRWWTGQTARFRLIATRAGGIALIAGFALAAPLALHHPLGLHHPSRLFAGLLGIG